jgi:peptidoglycan/LPS O-acetylase OafA/YrhL
MSTPAVSPSPGEIDPSASPSLDQSDTLFARLPFIEGIRGYAALVVLFGHCADVTRSLIGYNSFLSVDWSQRVLWLAWPGTEMVYLFLAISGFSLFYSEDMRRRTRPPTRLAVYAGRRAWRILPTYYVAFAFGLVVLAVIPNHFLDCRWP